MHTFFSSEATLLRFDLRDGHHQSGSFVTLWGKRCRHKGTARFVTSQAKHVM